MSQRASAAAASPVVLVYPLAADVLWNAGYVLSLGYLDAARKLLYQSKP